MLRHTSLDSEPKPVCIIVWEQQRAENKSNSSSEFGQIAVNTFFCVIKPILTLLSTH